MRKLLPLVAALVLLPLPARAQMDSDFSIGGAARVGWSTTTCDAAATGAIRYNSGSGGRIDFCNGTVWANIDGGGANLSSIAAATAINTIDSLNFAQTWNWSTLSTQTAMAMNANAITSGKILDVASSAAGFTGTMANLTLSGSNAANTGTLLKSSVTGTLSPAVPLMVTNLGAGLSLRVNDETGDSDTTPFVVNAGGDVGIRQGTPAAPLHVNGEAIIGTTGLACSATTTGAIRFTSGGTPPWNYCNGSAWLPFERAPDKPGYFVQTATRWNGNLGGLTGANSKCLTELQTTYNWRGKSSAGTLTSTRVKAFLCDGTSCNNLLPNTVYVTAKANNTTDGGMAFMTDSSGQGYGFRNYVDYFNFDATFDDWMNRGTVDNFYWSTAPAGANHCTNWSSALVGNNGLAGNAGWDDSMRWNDGTDTCNVSNYLMCIVHPE